MRPTNGTITLITPFHTLFHSIAAKQEASHAKRGGPMIYKAHPLTATSSHLKIFLPTAEPSPSFFLSFSSPTDFPRWFRDQPFIFHYLV